MEEALVLIYFPSIQKVCVQCAGCDPETQRGSGCVVPQPTRKLLQPTPVIRRFKRGVSAGVSKQVKGVGTEIQGGWRMLLFLVGGSRNLQKLGRALQATRESSLGSIKSSKVKTLHG